MKSHISLSDCLDRAIRVAIALSVLAILFLIVHLGILFHGMASGHFPAEWKEWYDALEVVAHLAVAVIGGAWVYQHFVLFRESAWNIQVSQSHTTIELNAEKRLLCLDICLKNIGKVEVGLNVGNKEGLVVALGRIPAEMDGVIDDPQAQFKSVLSHDVGYDEISKAGNRGDDDWKWINVLRHYKKYYVLEPGVEYHEREYVVVDLHSLIYSRLYLAAVDGISMRDSMVIKIDGTVRAVHDGAPD